MKKTISPAGIHGTVASIASKSMAHRLMICGALAKTPTQVLCPTTSKDIEATRSCLAAIQNGSPILPCGESGSTLRFLLPVAAALGLEAIFRMEGRLPDRPLTPLDEELRRHGICLEKTGSDLYICGRLTPGDYSLPGNISSQFISGLLFALPLLDGPSTLTVTGKVESAPYIAMTLDALRQFGVCPQITGNVYRMEPAIYQSPGAVSVEGDWSNAAFWLCAGALTGPVTVTGLQPGSLQGDKAVLELLSRFGATCVQAETGFTVSSAPLHGIDIDAAEIPDLVPILSVVAAAAPGTTRIYHAGRLRLKESDRIETVCAMLTALGAEVEQTDDGMIIRGGKPLSGGTVDACNDHRIAMAAAVASSLCRDTVTVLGAEAVNKSYPHFWEDLATLQ